MSYLSGGTHFPSTKKATISLWFRVPAKVLTEITNEFKEWDSGGRTFPRRPLLGVVPLMVFGDAPTDRDFYFPSRLFGTYTRVSVVWTDGPDVDPETGDPTCVGAGLVMGEPQTVQMGTNYYSFERGNSEFVFSGAKRDPSYIGVDCSGDKPALSVNIRMPTANTANWSGSWPATINETMEGEVWTVTNSGQCPGAPSVTIKPEGGLCFGSINSFTHTYDQTGSNADVVLGSEAELFRTLPAQRIGDAGAELLSPKQENYQGQAVSPDHWHHVLLSFDFTPKVSTRGVHMDGSGGDPGPIDTRGSGTGVEMWVAFDDKNLVGDKLSVYSRGGDNSVVSVHGNWIANDVTYSITDSGDDCQGNHYTIVTTQAQPRYDFTPAEVSFKNLGLPAPAAYVDAVRRVEMAELQVFTGVSVDTVDTTIRRAFVSGDGKPVPPTQKQETDADGRTTKDSGSIELLGQQPIILLHGSMDWKKGHNTGASAGQVAGKKQKPDQLTPVGGIEKYTPDPSLKGDQGKPDAKQTP